MPTGHLLPGEVAPPARMLLVSLIVLAPVCLLLGTQFAVACRVVARRTAVTQVYLLEAGGNILAGLAFHYYLADHLNPLRTMLLLSLP